MFQMVDCINLLSDKLYKAVIETDGLIINIVVSVPHVGNKQSLQCSEGHYLWAITMVRHHACDHFHSFISVHGQLLYCLGKTESLCLSIVCCK